MYKSNVNLNLYKTFYDVAKYGSISETAKNTFTSQPAISKSIKKLESELKTKLFYRNLNGVELTEKGKELLYFIEKAYSNLILAERTMLETENLVKGKLSIGMPSNIGSFFLFDKIIDFHEQYPKIEVTIITGSTSKLVNLLESHQVDFIIDTSPIDVKLSSELKITKLSTVNYSFIIKKDTKNIDYKKITSIKDLKKLPLILPIPKTANRNDLDALLKENNVEIENVINIHTSEMIISAVKKDLGIGYVIENLVESELKTSELEKLNIKEKLPTVDINIIFDKRSLTTAPKKFIEKYIDYNFKL